MHVRDWMGWAAAVMLGFGALPASAQITTIDPNTAIDSDLNSPPPEQQQTPPPPPVVDQGPYQDVTPAPLPPEQQVPVDPQPVAPAPQATQAGAPSARTQASSTYQRDDLIGAAEGVFGKGASGLAGIIEDILKEQGEPNAYIAGREASGAIGIGLRYGSGEMFHKVEGQRKVYWTGPSIGFDIGGDANKVFVLVYNLYDSQELYKRFPQGEGRVYFVGGFSASYLRRGDVVLIPVRMGVGWRLGVNAGYMKFSEKQRWLPF